MATDKKGFVLYNDIITTTEDLSDEEAGKLFKHIVRYVNDKNPVLEDRLLKFVFEPIKLQLKRDLVKYEEIKVLKAEQGKSGGIKSGIVRKQKSEEKERLIFEANEANALNASPIEAPASFASKIEANEPVTVTDTVTGTVNVKKENTAAIALPAIPFYKNVEKNKTEISVYIRTHKPLSIEPYYDLWNLFAKQENFKTVTAINDKRKKKFAIRIREPAFNFLEILKKVKDSTFAREGNWLGFDWIIENDSNYLKIIEGNYDNAIPTPVIPINTGPSHEEIKFKKIMNGETV